MWFFVKPTLAHCCDIILRAAHKSRVLVPAGSYPLVMIVPWLVKGERVRMEGTDKNGANDTCRVQLCVRFCYRHLVCVQQWSVQPHVYYWCTQKKGAETALIGSSSPCGEGMVPLVQLSTNSRIGHWFSQKYFFLYSYNNLVHSWLTTAYVVPSLPLI